MSDVRCQMSEAAGIHMNPSHWQGMARRQRHFFSRTFTRLPRRGESNTSLVKQQGTKQVLAELVTAHFLKLWAPNLHEKLENILAFQICIRQQLCHVLPCYALFGLAPSSTSSAERERPAKFYPCSKSLQRQIQRLQDLQWKNSVLYLTSFSVKLANTAPKAPGISTVPWGEQAGCDLWRVQVDSCRLTPISSGCDGWLQPVLNHMRMGRWGYMRSTKTWVLKDRKKRIKSCECGLLLFLFLLLLLHISFSWIQFLF